MSKKATNLKYPMVDLLTAATMSIIYLNVVAASNLLFVNAPFAFIEAWMKELRGLSVASLEQKGPLSHNHQIDH